MKLISLIDSPDDRIAFMAADKVLERAWGRPREDGPGGKRFSDLPPEERAKEAARIIAAAREVLAAAKIVDGEVADDSGSS